MTPEEQAAEDRKKAEVEAARKAAGQPFTFDGDVKFGGPFTIRGDGFGTSGTLTIGGQPVKTTRWTDRSIKGITPAGLSGEIVLTTTRGTRRGTAK